MDRSPSSTACSIWGEGSNRVQPDSTNFPRSAWIQYGGALAGRTMQPATARDRSPSSSSRLMKNVYCIPLYSNHRIEAEVIDLSIGRGDDVAAFGWSPDCAPTAVASLLWKLKRRKGETFEPCGHSLRLGTLFRTAAMDQGLTLSASDSWCGV